MAEPENDRGWLSGPGFWLALGIVALVALSEHLAFNRIFQVDEFQYVFTARLLATKQTASYFASANLMLLGPMTWIAGAIDRAGLLMRVERLPFLALFWLNLCLIVRCAGIPLRSKKGLFALLLASTLAPLWDYGFEIRHENPMLTAILLAWSFARPLIPDRKRRLYAVGALAVIAQFIAFKAFVYAVPIVAFGIAAAWLYDRRALWKCVAETAAGALGGSIVALAIHWLAGTWSFFTNETKGLSSAVMQGVTRFSPFFALQRLPRQTPVLLIAIACGLTIAFRHARWKEFASRDSLLPEAYLVAVGLGAILVNPTPFPYNLLIPVSQAAILCLRMNPLEWSPHRLWKPALALLLVIHFGAWLLATSRHLYMTNAHQTELASLAEEMTDPKLHCVLDGVGMVSTRHPPNRYWLITFLTINWFKNGTFPPFRAQLAEGHTPIVIPNYRITWLPIADRRYIAEHYLPLAGDFLVAGTALKSQWDCPVAGRYFLSNDAAIDGQLRQHGPIVLTRGPHTFGLPAGQKGYVVWLGPTLEFPPAVSRGDVTRVLVNWY
jgi:hypothetical protein